MADIPFCNNTFKRRDRIRNAIEQCLKPEFQRISENPDVLKLPMWKITVNGLVVYWSENSPHIVEIEPNGELCFHEHFHAIGSGTQTAYAIWSAQSVPGYRRASFNPHPRNVHSKYDLRRPETPLQPKHRQLGRPTALLQSRFARSGPHSSSWQWALVARTCPECCLP